MGLENVIRVIISIADYSQHCCNMMSNFETFSYISLMKEKVNSYAASKHIVVLLTLLVG